MADMDVMLRSFHNGLALHCYFTIIPHDQTLYNLLLNILQNLQNEITV